MFKEQGNKGYKTCFLSVLGLRLDKGLKSIRNDDDIKKIIKYVLDVDEIKLFYKHHHEVITLQVIELPCNKDNGGHPRQINIGKEQQVKLV